FCGKQKTGNHKKQGYACASYICHEVRWRGAEFRGPEIKIPYAGMVQKDEKCQISSQSVNCCKAPFSFGSAESPGQNLNCRECKEQRGKNCERASRAYHC